MGYSDTAPKVIQDLADALEDAEVWYAAGGIWAVYITREGGAYALVTEDDETEGGYMLGAYASEEDEGVILKTWARANADDDADVIRTTLMTWEG